MDSNPSEILQDFPPLFRIYKNGHVERFKITQILPPSDDPQTGVRSKDSLISPENAVSARLFLPKTTHLHRKLPLLIYIHGGAFSIESAFSPLYHHYVTSLAAAAKVIAVSIEYRLAPEHPVPACYDDSWSVLQWVTRHANGSIPDPDPWLVDHADFTRVFLAGDSAGANIAHNMAVRAGVDGLGSGLKIVGVVLVQPFFGNDEIDKLWMLICPETSGINDPRLNPAADPGLLAKLGCTRVLVCVAGKDHLRERGWSYYEALKKSEWGGSVEIEETEGEPHVFHLFDPACEKARTLMKRVVSFMNQD
ncbi:hypothetical protein ACSBR2_001863 [Camellia fascicularis]